MFFDEKPKRVAGSLAGREMAASAGFTGSGFRALVILNRTLTALRYQEILETA